MSRTVCRLAASCTLALTLQVSPVAAQSATPETPAPGWARVSFFGNASVNTPSDGSGATTLNELITTAAIQSPTYAGAGTEYGADLRFAKYPSSAGRVDSVSIYDAYLTRRMASGHLAVKAGQMWLNELGSLGSVGGALVEVRQSKDTDGSRWRGGVFTGLEPEILSASYASGVRKTGGYVAYDGVGAQRDVAGFVTIKNEGLTERSVLMTNNFLPMGKRVFVFQSAEYDLIGPAGNGSGGLSYFFTNARVTPNDRIDLQATFHRGRSIDVRTISIDTLNGRPIDQRAVEGLLFESVGGRVTAALTKSVRLFGGYARDQTNQDAVITGRATFGAYISNIRSTGFDFTVSDAKILHNGSSSYDSWYVSAGHTIGARAYLSADFTTSLSTLDLSSGTVAQIQTNPRTERFSGSATVNLNRTFSLLVTADHTIDPSYTENRVLAGISCRAALK